MRCLQVQRSTTRARLCVQHAYKDRSNIQTRECVRRYTLARRKMFIFVGWMRSVESIVDLWSVGARLWILKFEGGENAFPLVCEIVFRMFRAGKMVRQSRR